MKAKKVLLIISGVFKSIVGGGFTLFGLLVLFLGSLIKSMFTTSYDLVQTFINELIAIDESYAYLATYNQDQAIGYVMSYVYSICAIFIIIGLINILFAVLNFLCNKKIDRVSKKQSIWLIITSWVFSLGLISNTLTTIALCLKKKGGKMASSNNQINDIPTYQV